MNYKMIYKENKESIFQKIKGQRFFIDEYMSFCDELNLMHTNDYSLSDKYISIGNMSLNLSFIIEQRCIGDEILMEIIEVYKYPIYEDNKNKPKFDFSIITANDFIEDAKRLENELNK